MNPTDLYFVIAPICAFESQLKDELTPWVTMDAGVRQGWTVPKVKVMLNGAPFPITF